MLITIKKLLEDELRRSIQNNSLTERFKQIVFYTVHNALIQFYGSNYSTRCLQSTLGIRLILQKFEINSVFVEGSVCFGLVFGKNPYFLGWGGFWDKDHHYWLVSQFGDIIDLTISQLHLHPQKKREDQIPLLPIWWSPLDQLPPLFRYLQNTYGNPKIDLSESENQIFINYTKYLQDKIESGTIDTDAFQHFNILTGEEKLSKLYENKNPWPFVILDNHDKMDWPKWIKNKETNLLKKHYENHPNDNLG